MKTISDAAASVLKTAEDNAAKGLKPARPVDGRATEAKVDFMDGLPPEMRALAIREVENVIDLCESPIEQVALYQLAGHNFGNAEYPARCRILRTRGEIGYYPDRIHLIPQVVFGPYRVDLLLDIGGSYLIAIECDGKAFHMDKERDSRRDKVLRDTFGVRVLRAPGGDIWRNNALIAALADDAKSGR